MTNLDFKLNFDNTEISFANKSDKKLKKSYLLFKIMNSNFFSNFINSLVLTAFKCKLPIQSLIKNSVFKQFCGGETLEESVEVFNKLKQYNILSMVGYGVEVKNLQSELDHARNEIIRVVEMAGNGTNIPCIAIKFTGLARVGLLEKIQKNEVLTSAEKEEFLLVKERLIQICKKAKDNNVIINIDAEESWLQNPIDNLVNEMMEKYNQSEITVQNTIQLYRTDRLQFLKDSFDKARSGNYILGMKLVRGAYLEKENNRAKEMDYKSPMQPDKKSTDKDYNLAIKFCMEHIDDISFNIASHNEESNYYATRLIHDHQIPKDHPHIFFSQLYGMSDHISYNLAAEDYNICKYIPYGPIKELIPFLIRRVKENRAVLGQMSRELSLIKKEIRRRQLV